MVSFNQMRCTLFKKASDVEQDSQLFNKEKVDGNQIVNGNAYNQSSGFVQLAGVVGAFAVAFAAYGAHVLRPRSDVPDDRKQIFDTGNIMHFIHALALLGVPLTNKPSLVGIFLLLGLVLFCGACYITAITGNYAVSNAAPFGGISFILGWTCMIL